MLNARLSILAASLLAISATSFAAAFDEADATAWVPTTDYYSSWFHAVIKGTAIYNFGHFGLGVRVGVVDSGIQLNHTEFAGRIVDSKSFVDGNATGNDDNGHGTHVAGIIAAAGNGIGTMGVAPGASLINVKVFSAAGAGKVSTMLAGINYAVNQGASVVNFSGGWTAPATSDVASLKQAVNAGSLLVAAAGNDGGANPLYPARYAKESWANSQILAVGAVDTKNTITSWSNRAGDTMNYYLVAPGTSIKSTYNNGGYATMSGTSMAAPVVTGAAALLKSYWPKLTARQIGEIFLTTATDLGAKGVDVIYGRGLLNLEAALKPAGALKLAAAMAAPVPLTRVMVPVPHVLAGMVFTSSKQGLLKTSLTDEFGRNFDYDAGENVVASTASFGSRLDVFMAEPSPDAASDQGITLTYLSRDDGTAPATSAAAMPYLGFLSGSLAVSKNLSSDLGGVRLGIASGLPDTNGVSKGNALTLGWNQSGWNLVAGVTRENSSFMGSSTSGALDFGTGTSTFLSADKSWNVGDWKAHFVAAYGVSTGSGTSGMILGVTPIHAVSLAADMTRSNTFKTGDSLTFGIAQPLKAIKGTMNVETASYDANGDASFKIAQINLADSATEVDLTLGYRAPVGKLASMSVAMGYRMNADQISANNESYAMLAWKQKF
jgi:hypothetical protein